MVSEYTEEVWSPRRESNPTFVPRRCVPLELDSSLPQRAYLSGIQPIQKSIHLSAVKCPLPFLLCIVGRALHLLVILFSSFQYCAVGLTAKRSQSCCSIFLPVLSSLPPCVKGNRVFVLILNHKHDNDFQMISGMVTRPSNRPESIGR